MTRRIAAFLLSIAVLAIGCSGSSETLTLDEYFSEIEAIFDAIDDEVDAQHEQGRAAVDEINEDVDAFLADEANLPVLKNLALGAYRVRILGDALERLNALEPPAEAEEAHNDLIDAGEDVVVAFEEVMDAVQGAETIAELRTLDVSPMAAQDSFTDACLDLMAVARDRGLSPAVGCGSII